MRTVYGDHERFVETYFSTYPGQLLHRRRLPPRRGRLLLDHRPRRRRDQRLRPPHGHGRGRSRAGRRIAKVAEAAVVGYPARHQGPGHLRLCHADGRRGSQRRAAARNWCSWVRKEIGPIASPDLIQFAPGLPKTRSGKIMRRILRKIAEDDFSNLGDTSTLAEPARRRRSDRATARTGRTDPARHACNHGTARHGACRSQFQRLTLNCTNRAVRDQSGNGRDAPG